MSDPVAVQNIRDAIGYSDLCNKAEQIEAYSAEQERKLNAVLNGIRKLPLTHAEAHQILVTLSAEMQRKGYSATAIAAVDEASDL